MNHKAILFDIEPKWPTHLETAPIDLREFIELDEVIALAEDERARANHFHRRAQEAEGILERLAYKLNANGTTYQELCEGIDRRGNREYWDGVRYPLWKRVVKFIEGVLK